MTSTTGIEESHADLFEASDPYLVVIGNCVGKKVSDRNEPLYKALVEKYPYANLYPKRVDGTRDRPGTIKIMGGDGNRKIVICMAQYYSGKNALPNDNQDKRLIWFKQCLEKIARIPNLKGVAFPQQICQDGGGDWEGKYLPAIVDFANYTRLDQPVKVTLYPHQALSAEGSGRSGRGADDRGENGEEGVTSKRGLTPSQVLNQAQSKKRFQTMAAEADQAEVISLSNLQKKIYRLDQLYWLDDEAMTVVNAPKIKVKGKPKTNKAANPKPKIKLLPGPALTNTWTVSKEALEQENQRELARQEKKNKAQANPRPNSATSQALDPIFDSDLDDDVCALDNLGGSFKAAKVTQKSKKTTGKNTKSNKPKVRTVQAKQMAIDSVFDSDCDDDYVAPKPKSKPKPISTSKTSIKMSDTIPEQTANGRYRYDQEISGKTLDWWGQEAHRALGKSSGWRHYPLKRGQFGYDNMIVSVGFALEMQQTEADRDREQVADWIHQGWTLNYTYWRDQQPWKDPESGYKKPSKNLTDKRRKECAAADYNDLPQDEKDKDLIIADFVLANLTPKIKPTTKTKAAVSSPTLSSVSSVSSPSSSNPSSPSTSNTDDMMVPVGIEPPDPKYVPTEEYDENPEWTQALSQLPIHKSWVSIFQDSKIQSELRKLDKMMHGQMESFGDFSKILPQPPHMIFNAFNQCHRNHVRVVILGQDPYHSKPEQAMGLSFSVQKGVKPPPSLINIFKELKTDIKGFQIPKNGDLTAWTEQGVLLLNTSLTVRSNKPGCHLQQWEPLTDRVIKLLSEDSERPKIFLLWGKPAQAKAKLINKKYNKILIAAHPSPMSANRRGWFGTKHFSKTNEILEGWNEVPIDWRLEN